MWLPDPRFEMPELFEPKKKPSGQVVLDMEHPLSRGLAGYWLLQGDGVDLTGNSNGTVVAGSWTGAGNLGQAFEVATTSDWVEIPEVPALDLSTYSSVTVFIFFVPLAVVSNKTCFSQWSGASGQRTFIIQISAAADTIQWCTNNYAGAALSTTLMQVGVPAFVVGTWNGSNQKIYVNGKLEATDTSVEGTLDNSGEKIVIGGRSSGGTVDINQIGKYLCAGIYKDRELTATEIKSLYDIHYQNLIPA